MMIRIAATAAALFAAVQVSAAPAAAAAAPMAAPAQAAAPAPAMKAPAKKAKMAAKRPLNTKVMPAAISVGSTNRVARPGFEANSEAVHASASAMVREDSFNSRPVQPISK